MPIPGESSKGFFASLFDFNFTSFITLKFLKLIYGLLIGFTLLFGVIFFIGSLARGSAIGVFTALILVPIGTLFYLIILRVYMEVLALFFRIGENTQAIRQSLGGSGGGGGGFGAYPQPGPPPGPAPSHGGSWGTPSPQPSPPPQNPQVGSSPQSPPGYPPQ